MRVVTTCHQAGLAEYGQRWLDSRHNWPAETEFWWYTEGYGLPLQTDELQMVEQGGAGKTGGWIERRDFRDMPVFTQWKAKHSGYVAPSWQWDVVKFAHKVFAACDALYDYDGIGVWLDADCVTYQEIPGGLMEGKVKDAYLAHYARTGMYTETGLWIMDCSHSQHKAFLDAWRNWYLAEAYKQLPQWHDCWTLDSTLRTFVKDGRVKTHSLSGEHAKDMHPQSKSELGRYIDHAKGPRKRKGQSPENKYRKAYDALAGRFSGEGPLGMRYTQLIDAVRAKQPKVILEIGTWNGDRAKEMLAASPNSHYIGFDLFEDATPETDTAEMNVKRHNKVDTIQSKLGSGATLVKGNTRETLAAFSWPEPIDFVWIDGGHSVETIASDWENVQRLLAPDAEVYFDDYYSNGPDTTHFGCNRTVNVLPHEILPAKDRIVMGGFTQIAKVKWAEYKAGMWT